MKHPPATGSTLLLEISRTIRGTAQLYDAAVTADPEDALKLTRAIRSQLKTCSLIIDRLEAWTDAAARVA